MSKFDECVQQAIKAGTLSPRMADALRTDAMAFEAKLRAEGIHTKEQAKILGVEQAAKHRKLIAMRSKYQKVLQHTANKQNEANIASHPKSPVAGLMSLLVKDKNVHKGQTAWSNIDNRASSIEGQAHSMAVDMLQHLHTTHLGMKQDNEAVLAMVRELFGESTGNAKAAKAATAFEKTSEYLRERANRAGSFIPKLLNWGMPQNSDQIKVSNAAGLKKADMNKLGPTASTKKNMDAWIGYLTDPDNPKLNREAMLNADGRTMTDDELLKGLQEAFRTITTNGQNKQVAGSFKGNGKLANRHQDSRFLIFKDANSWIEYQKKFGNEDFFNVMVGHMKMMSNEIAMLEILGPSPTHAFNYLSDIAKLSGGKKGFWNEDMGGVESVWNVVNGSVDMVDMSRDALAKRAAITRHALMMAQLGGATLSAMSDPVYGKMTRGFNGIPAGRMIQSIAKQLDPTDESDRAFSAHMGMVMDSWTAQALVGSRFGGDVDPSGFASKGSEILFRATGLTAWTQGQRNAFGLDFQWHLGRQMGKPLADVEAKFQSMMRRYGITDSDWEVMRTAKLEDHGGAQYFRPQNMHDLGLSADVSDNLVTKVLEAMNTEMDFAVPVPDARVRAIQTWGGKNKGSYNGELARMTMMYKSFSLTQFFTHMHRSGTGGAAVYAIRIGVALSLVGAMSLQSKEVTKGRKPRDMDNFAFWGAAMMQGGGLGIFGDFIDASGIGNRNRFGNSPIATLAGPGGSFIEDVLGLGGSVFDSATDPFTGGKTNLGRESARFLQKYTPYNNVWYARLALERLIFDNITELADDTANANWKKYERKIKTERGQEYWFKRGETSPSF